MKVDFCSGTQSCCLIKTLQTFNWLLTVFVYSPCVRPPSYQCSQAARLELCSPAGGMKMPKHVASDLLVVNISGMVMLASSLTLPPLFSTLSCLPDAGKAEFILRLLQLHYDLINT